MSMRIIAVAMLTFASQAIGGEIYKFDQSQSTIAFSVHQFLGTTHGKFTKFDGKIERRLSGMKERARSFGRWIRPAGQEQLDAFN